MKEDENESSKPLLLEESLDKTSTVIEMLPKNDETSHLNVYIDPEFSKEPFNVDITESKPIYTELAEEYNNIDKSIGKITSELLYHWTDVPVVLPKSIIQGRQMIGENDLFLLPTLNETESLSVDQNGEPKKLNSGQLDQLKKTGRFDVPSENFANKNHTWKLARWLQKGSDKSTETFSKDLSKALRLLIITARNRFTHKKFSLLQGLRSYKNSLFDLADIFIGMPHKTINDSRIVSHLSYSLEIFLVSELAIDESNQKDYEEMCKKIVANFKKRVNEVDQEELTVPHRYRTPQGLLIDFRLLDRRLMRLIKPILTKLSTNTVDRKMKLNKLRQQLITEYREQNFAKTKIVTLVEKRLDEEYIELLLQDIEADAELEVLSSGIGKALCDHIRARILMEMEIELIDKETEYHMEQFKAELVKKNGIKASIRKWLDEKMEAERERVKVANGYAYQVRSIPKLKEANLYQAAYFAEREILFYKTKKASIIEEESKKKEPRKEFKLYRKIWFPKNYIVEKHDPHDAETFYTMETNIIYKNSTMYPFWRWKQFFLRTWIYFINALFIFAMVIPFCSAFSYRALFARKPFYPRKKVNKNTGLIEPDMSKSNRTLTLISRINAITKNIRSSRNKFESVPDSGLLGKNVIRIFHLVWNYFFKGFIGILGLVLIFPLLCVIISTISLVLSVTSPIWYPFLSIVHHLCFVVLYDWENPRKRRFYRIVFPIIKITLKFIIYGIISPILAVFTALVLCPIGSLFVFLFALVRKTNRSFCDFFMFHVFLKRFSRVPGSDSFAAIRISGPGLASNYLYQIWPEQALAAVEISLEIEILKAFNEFIRIKLGNPVKIYKNIFQTIMDKYSLELTEYGGAEKSYNQLKSEEIKYTHAYATALNNRLDKLREIVSKDLGSVRLSEANLAIVLSEATKLVQFNYENVILKYTKQSIEDLFKDLEEDDWSSFTSVFLEKIFGHGIMTPIEETDDFFNLEVKHLNLKKYTKMIADSELRDDLESVHGNYRPESKQILVQVPNNKDMLIRLIKIADYYRNHKFHFSKNDGFKENFSASKLPKSVALTGVIIYNESASEKIKYDSLEELDYKLYKRFSIL